MAETLRRVLSAGSATGLGEEGGTEVGSPLLLLGGPGSGKTALLFAAALEAAGEGRGPVLFLTRRPLQSVPRRSGPALDPLRLQKIRFQYPPTTQELLRSLCSAHETRGPTPALLLVDSLEDFLEGEAGAQDAARLAALLLDTVAHFSQRAGPGGSCGLLVALQTPGDGDRDGGEALLLPVLLRYFPARCWLQPGPCGLHACLEPGGRAPRAEWLLAFSPDGEMTATRCSTCSTGSGAQP